MVLGLLEVIAKNTESQDLISYHIFLIGIQWGRLEPGMGSACKTSSQRDSFVS